MGKINGPKITEDGKGGIRHRRGSTIRNDRYLMKWEWTRVHVSLKERDLKDWMYGKSIVVVGGEKVRNTNH